MTAVSRAMEPNWGSQNFYTNYYPHEPSRSSDRPLNSPPGAPGAEGPGGGGNNHHGPRRSFDQPPHQSFLPPPPPPHESSSHAPGNSMNLPPFSSTFYGGTYHSPSGNHPGGSASAPLHLPHNMNYGSHVPMGAPNSYPYPVTSPMGLPASGLSRAPPGHSYNESPRIPGYSSSPGTRHLSPNSPTTHLAPPGITQSTGSSSSSSFPSIQRTPAHLPKSKRRSGGSTHSNESWDENDKSGGGDDEKGEHGEMPWGMPQDEYKALNPRDKKQVRNRIGARRFRAKRKDYVSNLEGSLRERDDEIASLRGQVDAQRTEINDLRHRLGMPMIPIPPPAAGLGLVVEADGWPEGDGKGGRKGIGE